MANTLAGLMVLSLTTVAVWAADSALPTSQPSGVEGVQPLPLIVSPKVDPPPVGEVNKRLFGVIPNYRADQAQDVYVPLTTQQKFQIAHSDSFDWPNYFLLVGYTLQTQMASGGFSHSGGVRAFGSYYARGVGDQIIGSYLTEAILPSLLHEDPRFFRLGTGTFLHRTLHAAASVVVTHHDDGRLGFNFSEVLGNMGVIAVSSLYYPASQSASEGVDRLGMQLGNDVVSNLITEFWPDVKRHLPFHRAATAEKKEAVLQGPLPYAQR